MMAKISRSGPETTEGDLACGVVLYQTPQHDLRRLVRSVEIASRTAGADCRLIAIDNSNRQSETTFRAIAGGDLSCTLLPSEGNIGFGAGHNRLMTSAFAAGATHYLALNPDGFLHPDALLALLSRSEIHHDYALIEGRQFPNEHPKIYDPETFVTPWCSGACMMISRRLYAKIGGFDEGFFMYCEDVDYSWRARAAGAPCIFAADAFFFHDILDRPQSTSTRWHMALSMKRLISRWRPKSIPEALNAHLSQMLIDLPYDAARLGSKPDIRSLEENSAAVADFEHHFGFAPVRWA